MVRSDGYALRVDRRAIRAVASPLVIDPSCLTAITPTTMTADHNISIFTNLSFVISPRLRRAAARGQIGFAYGPVNLRRWSRRLETVSQQESFQSDGANPEGVQR